MNVFAGRDGGQPGCGWRIWPWRIGRLRQTAVAVAAGLLSSATQADNFANVYYAARKDQLVVTIAYRGTNPDHSFSLKWGRCQELGDGGRAVSAEVLDSQWQDVEQNDYKKTTRFGLADMPCRPATVTLRSAPRFFTTLQIPAKAVQAPINAR